MHSCLYRGSLSHHRGGAVKNNFTYDVYTVRLDLDELDELDASLKLFSLERRNFFSLTGRDYGLSSEKTRPSERPRPQESLKARALELLASAQIACPIASIDLVTQLRVFGFVFNPVSFFLAYGADNQLVAVIAEINNTYNQTFAYVLDERSRTKASETDETDDSEDIAYTSTKSFFVSPFIGDDCSYEWIFPTRRDAGFDLRMRLSRPNGGRFFAVRLRGERTEISNFSLLRALIRFPALPTQIWLRIHLQALRLRAMGLQYRRPQS